MDEILLSPIYGTIDLIQDTGMGCCDKMITVTNDGQTSRFTLTGSTYVIDNIRLEVGMQVVFFYNTDTFQPLIYPPQFDAVIVGQYKPWENIMVDYFDDQFISYNQTLKLNISPCTEIITTNGQGYTCSIQHHLVIIFYRETTRSIPAQTAPQKIIVFC